MEKLPENVKILFLERIDRTIMRKREQNKEYQLSEKRSDAYVRYLYKQFTPEMKKIYLRWEEVNGLLISYENLWAYQQGMEDGIRLVQEIQSLGNR